MEPPALTCPPSPARDQPAPAPCPAGPPGGQASPGLTLGPVILPPPEPGLAPALLLKALPVPLYHMVPPGGLQPRAPLLPGSLEGGGAPFLLSPLLPPEGPGAAQGKRGAPTLTVNLVGALPVLSPGPGPPLGSPGRARGAGRHLCPHCGRDCGKPSVLEKHIRSHTGERPFPCASCGIAFKTQSNLYKHRRTQTHLGRSRARPDAPESPRPAPAAARPDPGDRDPPAEAAAPGDEEDLAPRRKLPEQKPPAAGRPGPAPQPWEKAGDARPGAPEGRLRKCESTDSGYLSRSDSAEQPPAPGSPLPSAEPDGEGAAGGAPRGPGLALEKRQLEERIARLISHNQAVVADPQLDHVRPRRSLLGPQGSLDLAPGALRGSFHVGPREPRRCPAPARSALGPPERARPLFFHSVPTQLSTAAECVPVTRSNSLPAVEGARTWPEPSGPRRAAPRGDGLPSPRPGPALTVVAVPSGHPRALVRQAAVEDLPGPPEEPEGPRAEGGGPAAGRARGAKRGPARRPQMFSQEKWRVYSRDAFQKLYRKTGSGRPGGGGARGAPGQGGVSVRVQPGPRGPSPAAGTGLAAESPTRGDTGARAGGADESGGLQAPALPTLSCQEAPGLGQRDLPLAGADPRRAGSPGQCGGCSGGPPLVEGSPLETKRVKVEEQSGPGCLGAGATGRGSPHGQDTPSSGNKEPPLCPEAAGPQLAAPPGVPSVLTAPPEPPFPPKYLLRLPHGEAPGRAHPASGGSGPGTSDFKETPSGSRSGDRRKGELQGDGRGCGGTPPTPEAGDCPREGAALPPTPTWDPQGAKNTKGGNCGVPGGAWDCAGGRPGAPSRERGASLEDPSQASEGPHAAPASPAHSSGTAGGHGAPFPSLRAEPQLTWCCLHRSLPLALEQRDSGASAYLAPPPALATPGGSPGPRGQTQPPASQLPCPRAPGGATQPWAPERNRKDSQHQGSTKRARGNSQQHRASSTAKRYKGTLCPSRAQLRAGRLRRAHLARRRERRGPGPPGTGPRRTPAPAACRRAGRPVRGEPPAPAPAAPPAGGRQEKPDHGPPLTSGRFVPRPGSRTAKVAPKVGVLIGPHLSPPMSTGNMMRTAPRAWEETPPSADDFAGRAPQDSPGGSGSSLPPRPCVDTASLLLRGKRLDPGLTPTQPPCPEKGPPAALPCTSAVTPELCPPESNAPPADSPRREAGPQDGDATTEAGPASPGPQRGPRPSLGAASGPTAQDTPDPQEGRLEPPLSPTGQARRGAASGEARGVVQPPGPVAPKLPADAPEALPRAPKRRSLEGMRKQRRVEPSDSSSDDEDRLVIEL